MSGKNSNWLSDIKQCIHYKEPGLDCTLDKKSSGINTKSFRSLFRFTTIDNSNFDKQCSDAHFASFLFYYYCSKDELILNNNRIRYKQAIT